MPKLSHAHIVTAIAVLSLTASAAGFVGMQEKTAKAERNDGIGMMVCSNISESLVSGKKHVEQRIVAGIEAARQEKERELAEVQAALQAAADEEKHRALEAAEKAAEEALREAEALGPQISYTPGEGDYADVLMIGDSIMVFTSNSLYYYLPGVTIDACSARSLETGGVMEGSGPYDGVLDHVRALNPDQFSRYVIGTGNNDWNGMDLAAGEEIVSCLAGKQIWFVTEFVSNNAAGTDNTNATIDELCARYPNVHKIDWYALASDNQDSFLQGDNCHPQTQESHDVYAGLVKAALDR